MRDKELTWRIMKGLHQIYERGSTSNNIKGHSYVQYLLKKEVIRPRRGYPHILDKGFDYDEVYEGEHLQDYLRYQDFFDQHDFLKPQSNYREKDIRVLMFVAKQKAQIQLDQYSRKKFSTKFFKDEDAKHLDNFPALERAILDILGQERFVGADPKDHQYRFVLDCPNPRLIVLCENLDFLLYDEVARANRLWLWYAGGSNIAKLDYLPPIKYPIYYSCDWDYHGLKIYEGIRKKIPQIQLLYPTAIDEAKPVDSGTHKSDWKYEKTFSGLNRKCYSVEDVALIEKLIKQKQWIEEEANDLIIMLDKATTQ
jgi:hypothetical protein